MALCTLRGTPISLNMITVVKAVSILHNLNTEFGRNCFLSQVRPAAPQGTLESDSVSSDADLGSDMSDGTDEMDESDGSDGSDMSPLAHPPAGHAPGGDDA